MRALVSLVSGLIFGIGLIVADMTNPVKVQNFLDITGTWDPSLILVMGAAIGVTMPGYWYLRKHGRPLFSEGFSWPTRTDLDAKLITGAAMFGFGWGLGGFCPGPALTALPGGAGGGLVFVVAMLAGLCLSNILTLRMARRGIA